MLRALVLLAGVEAINLHANGNQKNAFLECGDDKKKKDKDEKDKDDDDDDNSSDSNRTKSSGGSKDEDDEVDIKYEVHSDHPDQRPTQKLTVEQISETRSQLMSGTGARAGMAPAVGARNDDGLYWADLSMLPLQDSLTRARRSAKRKDSDSDEPDSGLGHVYSDDMMNAKKLYYIGLELMKNVAVYEMKVDEDHGVETYLSVPSSKKGTDEITLNYKFHQSSKQIDFDLQKNGDSLIKVSVTKRSGNVNKAGFQGSKKGYELGKVEGSGLSKDFTDSLPEESGESIKKKWIG